MGQEPYILGIDIGTTTCRCALFDLRGAEIAAAARELTVRYPRQLWAEIDPDIWWQAAVAVIREVLAHGVAPTQIAGIGLSGLMHAPVLLDDGGRPVAPAQLWMDQRCASQCEAMRRELGASADDAPAEWPVSTSHSAPKLRWLAETQPEVLARARVMVLPKDYVRFRLTGALCTDPSDASGTGLLDRTNLAWDARAVALARVPRAILPPIQPSAATAGRVTLAAARETGLAPGTVVATGGGDTFCTLLGAGDFAARELCMYLGTAAWIALVEGRATDGQAIVGGFGATATTGAALRWARDLLAGEAIADVAGSYDALTRLARDVPPGAEGLFFLPHLMGERGPSDDPQARGALVGLTLRHNRPQTVRAVLEGTAFHLRRLLDVRTTALWLDGLPATGVACGGAAHSPVWMQVLADITQMRLRVPLVVEGGVLGAAMLGGAAAGVLSLATAATRLVHAGTIYIPNAALAPVYGRLYSRYCELDDLLAPWFRAGDLPGDEALV